MPFGSETGSGTSELQISVDRVLAPLDDDQQRLVDLVGDTFAREGWKWPTFQFVEALLDQQRLDARSIIASFPWVGNVSYRYGAVRSISWAQNMGDRDPVRLSILGLHHYRGTLLTAEAAIRQVFEIMGLFVAKRRSFHPSPSEVEGIELTDREVADHLRGNKRLFLGADLMLELMLDEPAFSGSTASGAHGVDFHWSWSVGRSALDFEDVATMEEYLLRVAGRYHLAPPAGLRVDSPRSLASAFDHLDVVWRLFHGKANRLVVSPSIESTTLLGSDVASRADYFEHLNALGDVFKHLNVPNRGAQASGHPLRRLRAYLESCVPSSSVPTINAAMDQLADIVAIRNGSAHAHAVPDALKAYRALGIEYPIADWGTAWKAVCGHAVAALNSIRIEVLALVDASNDLVDGLP